ncbi:hypothetical protein HYZ80_02330 [Candidatus Parcubacteria bacterium]|nr:hypothetical protein [Candidatus Parcubacteria bacterium]
MDDAVKRAFGIMAEQISIARDLSERRALKFRSDAGADISKHRRDQHGLYWDYTGYLDQERRDKAEIEALLGRFDRNQKKLAELLGTV